MVFWFCSQNRHKNISAEAIHFNAIHHRRDRGNRTPGILAEQAFTGSRDQVHAIQDVQDKLVWNPVQKLQTLFGIYQEPGIL